MIKMEQLSNKYSGIEQALQDGYKLGVNLSVMNVRYSSLGFMTGGIVSHKRINADGASLSDALNNMSDAYLDGRDNRKTWKGNTEPEGPLDLWILKGHHLLAEKSNENIRLVMACYSREILYVQKPTFEEAYIALNSIKISEEACRIILKGVLNQIKANKDRRLSRTFLTNIESIGYDEINKAIDYIADNTVIEASKIIEAEDKEQIDQIFATELLCSIIELSYAFLRSVSQYDLQQRDYIKIKIEELYRLYDNVNELGRRYDIDLMDKERETIKILRSEITQENTKGGEREGLWKQVTSIWKNLRK